MSEKEKELRKMSRAELIEIIYELEQREEEIEREKERLQAEKEELQHMLEERRILLSEAGSIAEAAMRLSRIFETAQETADQYLTSVAAMQEDSGRKVKTMITEAQMQADTIVAQAKGEAEEVVYSAKEYARKLQSEAENSLNHARQEKERIEAETDTAVAEKWSAFDQKVKEILEAHSELEIFLSHR